MGTCDGWVLRGDEECWRRIIRLCLSLRGRAGFAALVRAPSHGMGGCTGPSKQVGREVGVQAPSMVGGGGRHVNLAVRPTLSTRFVLRGPRRSRCFKPRSMAGRAGSDGKLLTARGSGGRGGSGGNDMARGVGCHLDNIAFPFLLVQVGDTFPLKPLARNSSKSSLIMTTVSPSFTWRVRPYPPRCSGRPFGA